VATPRPTQAATAQVISVFDGAHLRVVVKPSTLVLDMHNQLTNIQWAPASPGEARATATLVNLESATNTVRRSIEFRLSRFGHIGGVYSAEVAEAWAGSSPGGALKEIASWTLSVSGGLHWQPTE
jgi:hypothetical protein